MKKIVSIMVVVIIFALAFFASSFLFGKNSEVYLPEIEDASEYGNEEATFDYFESVNIKMIDKNETYEDIENGTMCTINYRMPFIENVNPNTESINLVLSNMRECFFTSKLSDFKKDPSSDINYDFTSIVTCNQGGILSIKESLTKDDFTTVSGISFDLSTGEKLLITEVMSMTYAKTSRYIKDKIINYVDEKYGIDVKITAFKKELDDYDIFDFNYYIEDGHICLFFLEEEYNTLIDAPLIIDIPR
ncbi:MAG: hypothetical protein ACI3XA_01490 [Clostridia bacterium]